MSTLPPLGLANQPALRLTPATYPDGLGAIDLTLPSARAISDIVSSQPNDLDMANPFGTSQLFTFFGQLLVHDTDLVRDNNAEILFPPGFDTPFRRSVIEAGSGTGTTPRAPINAVTSFVDASTVYGSTADVEARLRADTGGKLKVSGPDGAFLPRLATNPGTDQRPMYDAGDDRVNENPLLAIQHTLWVREHNWWAERLAKDNPTWSHEQIYQQAKARVVGEMQQVIYEEWLPQLVGEVPAYEGYKPGTDPRISVEALTAALRIGHTLMATRLTKQDELGRSTGDLKVRDLFFDNSFLASGQLDDMVRGLAAGTAQQVDIKVVDDLRVFLVNMAGEKKLDLIAINLMRGRDHGLAPYAEIRAAISEKFGLGLPPVKSFADISKDPALQAQLSEAYGGDVRKVDLFVGGFAEDPLPGIQVGPTVRALILDSFLRARDGDAAWHERVLSPSALAELEDTRFADIVKRVTGVEALQDQAFFAAERKAGTEAGEQIFGTKSAELILGLGGNDLLAGGDYRDSLYGGAGNDRLSGDQGDDGLFGGAGQDLLRGASNRDRLFGGEGNDQLEGGSAQDHLDGGQGRDLLIGGSAADRLKGGAGSDILIGGAHGDSFVLQDGGGFDRVRDFNAAEGDTLDLRILDGAVETVADLIADGFLRALSSSQPERGSLLQIGGDGLILEGVTLSQIPDSALLL